MIDPLHLCNLYETWHFIGMEEVNCLYIILWLCSTMSWLAILPVIMMNDLSCKITVKKAQFLLPPPSVANGLFCGTLFIPRADHSVHVVCTFLLLLWPARSWVIESCHQWVLMAIVHWGLWTWEVWGSVLGYCLLCRMYGVYYMGRLHREILLLVTTVIPPRHAHAHLVLYLSVIYTA